MDVDRGGVGEEAGALEAGDMVTVAVMDEDGERERKSDCGT